MADVRVLHVSHTHSNTNRASRGEPESRPLPTTHKRTTSTEYRTAYGGLRAVAGATHAPPRLSATRFRSSQVGRKIEPRYTAINRNPRARGTPESHARPSPGVQSPQAIGAQAQAAVGSSTRGHASPHPSPAASAARSRSRATDSATDLATDSAWASGMVTAWHGGYRLGHRQGRRGYPKVSLPVHQRARNAQPLSATRKHAEPRACKQGQATGIG